VAEQGSVSEIGYPDWLFSHHLCLAAIGKRFGDAGLADVLMESGIVASGSVAGVIEGWRYNRAGHTHKVHTVC